MVASRISDEPDVWTDDSYVSHDLFGVGAGGCGVYAHRSRSSLFQRRWGNLDLLPADGSLSVERCALFDSVRAPLQSVQRAEMWGVLLALQSSSAFHLGVDNFECSSSCLWYFGWSLWSLDRFNYVLIETFLLLFRFFIRERVSQTVRISKVKGHADDEMVRTCKARASDKIGNDLADRAA